MILNRKHMESLTKLFYIYFVRKRKIFDFFVGFNRKY